MAKIVPFVEDKVVKKRQFGMLRGKIKVGSDFEAPLPDEILESIFSDKL